MTEEPALKMQQRSPLVLVLGSVICIGLLGVLLWSPWNAPGSEQASLVMYCSAGIMKPVQEIKTEYEKKYHVTIQIEPGPTGALLTKIRTAPNHGDLFLAADKFFIEEARDDTPPRALESIPVATMRPVLALSKEGEAKVKSLDDLLKPDVKVVFANPVAAVGKLTKKLLTESGHWSTLEKQQTEFSAKVSLVGTVDEVSMKLQLGAADAGIVWNSSANQFGLKMIQIPSFDAAQEDITIAVLSSAKNPTAALHFARYLTSREMGQAIFAKHHFEPLAEADSWAERPQLDLMTGAMLRPGIEKTLKEFQLREGVDVNWVYNGCGILVTQMKGGLRPDAYFSCDVSFMTQVQDMFDSPLNITENDMVLLTPKGSGKVTGLESLLDEGMRVGVGHPTNSALGALTQQLLEEAEMLEKLKQNGNIKVESATGDFLVNQVVTGALDAVIVYRSNAMATKENLEKHLDMVEIKHEHARATQPWAVGKNSKHKQVMNRLLEAIRSQSSRQQFEAIGFRWKVEP